MNVTRIRKFPVSLGIAVISFVVNLSFFGALLADNTAATAATDVAPPGSGTQTGSAVSTEKGAFDWLDSKLPVHFTLDVNTYYDDNIFISPTKSSDYIFRISPGINYTLGEEGESSNYLALRYVPTIIEYYTHSSQDAVNQNADMVYEHNFQKLKLTLEQSYVHSNDTSIQAGAIVVSNIYDTHLSAHYDYNDKLSINADVNQSLAYYPSSLYSNVYEWSGGAYFLYQITPKISLGVGPRAGYDEIPGQPSQTWEQGLLHLTYNVTEKVTLTASGGGEVRQFDTNISDQVTGVFNVGAYWTPFVGTSLNITGYRRNAPSYSVGGTNFTATGISTGIRQNFLEDFWLGINGGYENDAYTPASQGITGARNDNYYYVRPYFQWTPQKWVSLTAYYQYSRNDSTLNVVSFNDNQVGASVSFRY
jgi:hypothetical protein